MVDEAYWYDLLEPFEDIRCRKMFGGFGIYRNDVMFALVADDMLYLKVDDESKPAFIAAGTSPFIYTGKGKPVEMSYWTPPEAFYDDSNTLLMWCERAFEAAQRTQAAKKPKR